MSTPELSLVHSCTTNCRKRFGVWHLTAAWTWRVPRIKYSKKGFSHPVRRTGETLEMRRAESGGSVFLDVFDNVSYALEFLGFLIRDFDGELFLKGHDEFHGIQGVGTEVFDEAGTKDDLLSIDAKLIDDDVTDFFFDGFF
jgi:hypothetical protein